MKVSSKRLLLLESYRGIAAVLIVCYHFSVFFKENFHLNFLHNFFLFGQSGIDFFFILSSFILAYRYSKTSFTLNTFYIFLKKRLIKIYPPYWIIAGVVGFIYLIFFPKVITPIFIFSSVTLYPYWPRLIPAAWTLFYELLFYIFFGITKAIKNKKINFFMIIIIFNVLLFYNFFKKQVPVNLLPLSQNFLDYLTHYIFIEFFIGLALYRLYILLLKKNVAFIKIGFIISFFILSVLAINFSFYFKELNEIRRLIFVALPIGSLILFSALFESKTSIMIPKMILIFGKSSYSIFITHMFILSVQSRFITYNANLNQLIYIIHMTAGITFAIICGIGYNLFVRKFLIMLYRT